MESMKIDISLQLPNETRHISFAAKERVALIGPSGCGKSTLVKVLVGISELGQGSFLFRDKDLMKLRPWQRSIGYVPQDLILMPHLNVRDNLLLPVRAKLDPEILEGLGVHHLLDRMPRHLSGGEKQRVALVRALSSNSELLILDEPFSSLDFKNKESLVGFVDQLCSRRKIPLVFISHEEKEIEFLKCERILF